MDAFFASVEQRDDPSLRGRPVVVGGSPDGRGVVAAASYESRKFGIRSAMSARRAKELCPELLFVKPRMAVYARLSRVIHSIMREHTELVEPLALDEAYLDVTVLPRSFRYASQVARRVRERIREVTGLPSSAGVSNCKFLAKLASKQAKPDGLSVIQPEEVFQVIDSLLVRDLPGVGRKTEEKFHRYGITHVRQIRDQTESAMQERFGKQGSWFYELAHGRDLRPVQPFRERKSVGAERTFSKDLQDEQEIQAELHALCSQVWERAERKGILARCVTVKLKTSDFELFTRSETKEYTIPACRELEQIVCELYDRECPKGRSCRLLGVSLSHFEDHEILQARPPKQLHLLAD